MAAITPGSSKRKKNLQRPLEGLFPQEIGDPFSPSFQTGVQAPTNFIEQDRSAIASAERADYLSANAVPGQANQAGSNLQYMQESAPVPNPQGSAAPAATAPGASGYWDPANANAAGAPLPEPSESAGMNYFDNPYSLLTQAVRSMGYTDWLGNPFIQRARSQWAPGLPYLWQYQEFLAGRDANVDATGMLDFARQWIDALGKPWGSDRSNSPLYSWEEFRELMRNLANGFVPSYFAQMMNVPNFTPQDQRDVIQSMLMAASYGNMNPMWRTVMLGDLEQKFNDYLHYLDSVGRDNPNAVDFLTFLRESGFFQVHGGA